MSNPFHSPRESPQDEQFSHKDFGVREVLLYLLARGCVNGAAELVFSEVAEFIGIEIAEQDIQRWQLGAEAAAPAGRAWTCKLNALKQALLLERDLAYKFVQTCHNVGPAGEEILARCFVCAHIKAGGLANPVDGAVVLNDAINQFLREN